MKKIFAIVFAAILCVACAVTAFAGEYTVGGDGNAVYDNAIGYVFDIQDINGTIEGEDATIVTSVDNLSKCGSWAIWLVAEEIGDTGIYKAVTDGAAMGGSSPSVTLEDNQIIIVVHSSSSNPNDAATYPNWEDKVACLAIKTGDCLVFDGINIDAGTCVNGTMTVVTQEDVDNGNIPETSVPEAESSEVVEESSEAVEESSEAEAESSATVEESKTESKAEASVEDPDVNTSDIETEDGGLGVWLWVIIGAAVVIVALVVVLVIKKK